MRKKTGGWVSYLEWVNSPVHWAEREVWYLREKDAPGIIAKIKVDRGANVRDFKINTIEVPSEEDYTCTQ